MPDYTSERLEGTLRVNLEAPMHLARALEPAMLEKKAGHMVFIFLAFGQVRDPALLRLQRHQVRPARLRPRPPHRSGATRHRRLDRLPGHDPRSRHVRRLRGQTDPRPRHRLSQQVADAVVKAIEHNKVEIAVAPVRQRALAHFALATPGISVKVASGEAGQKAAANVAKGQLDKH